MNRTVIGIITIVVLILLFPLVLTGIHEIQTDKTTDTDLAIDLDIGSESGQLTIDASTSDADMWAWDTGGGYTSVHDVLVLDGENGDVWTDDCELLTGQEWTEEYGYYVYRAVFHFDTSELPDNAIVDSASFLFFSGTVWDETLFNLVVVDGSGAHDPVVGSDYGLLLGRIVSGGSIASEDIVPEEVNEVVLNPTGIGWVSKTGVTILGLRTDRDINATVPTTFEYTIIVSADGNEIPPGEGAKLIINYSTTGIDSITLSQPLWKDNADSISSIVGDQGETLTVISYAPLTRVLTVDGVTTSTKATVVYETDALTAYTGIGAIVGIAPILIWIGLLAGCGYLTFRGVTSRGEAGRELH